MRDHRERFSASRKTEGDVDAEEDVRAAQSGQAAHVSQEELDAVKAARGALGRKRKRVDVARPRVAQTSLSEEEMVEVESAALGIGVTVSAWLRRLVLRELGVRG